MKTIQKTMLISLLFVSYNFAAMSQNLDTMSIAKRDSLLISIAKEVVLKYGPDYYREEFEPVIERKMVPPKGEINTTGKNANRFYYRVTYLYDSTQEQLSRDFAAKVVIWASNAKPSNVFFGNGWGRIIDDADLRSDKAIEPVLYQQKQIFPIYENIFDPDANPEPLNLEELKSKGYEEQSDGQWVKKTPDVPPPGVEEKIKK